MAIPAFSPPTWATVATPASTVLPSQLRLDGYAPFALPTSDQINRWNYEVGAYLTWLTTEGVTPFAVEHHPAATTDAYGGAVAAGSHKAMACDEALTIRGIGTGSGQGGRIDFRDAGRATDNRAIIGVGSNAVEGVGLLIDAIGSATSVALTLDGGLWLSTLSGGTWAFQCDSGSNQTLLLRNIGAGTASLSVDGDVGIAGTLSATGQITGGAGVESAWDADGVAFRFDGGGQVHYIDIPPFAGGWTSVDVLGGGATNGIFSAEGTPPYATPQQNAVTVLRRQLLTPHNNSTALAAGGRRILGGVQLMYWRADAAATITWRLCRVKRDGTAARDVLQEFDEVGEYTVTGIWGTQTNAFTEVLDPSLYTYYLELVLNQATSDDVRIGPMYLALTCKDAGQVFI